MLRFCALLCGVPLAVGCFRLLTGVPAQDASPEVLIDEKPGAFIEQSGQVCLQYAMPFDGKFTDSLTVRSRSDPNSMAITAVTTS